MTVTRDDYRFSHQLKTRYAETDMQGVIFYANYLVYYDTAITEYLRWLGWDYQGYVEETNNDFHVVKVTSEYLGSAVFDDTLDVCVRTGRLGNSSIAFDIGVFVVNRDNLLVNRGEVVWVNTDQNSHKAVPMDPKLPEIVATKDPLG